MKKILTVSLGALLIATAANADIASVDYVTNGLAGKQDASTIGTVTAANMGTTASTVVAAINEVATEAAAAQTTANTAKTNAATAQSTADTAKADAATAQSTANTAKANAATAQSTADTAKADAATAQSTAATAQSTANSALTKANAAVVANNAIQAGTGTKITYDSKGLVTGSSSLTASDIPTLSIDKVSGLQTALNDKQNASTAVRLTTTGKAVGDEKTPVYVDAGGVVTPITSYGGLAAQATKDGSGNVITTTYATKTELAGKQAALGYTPENSANKVTTATGLTASSTDTQYPSAKLVYTAVNGKQDKLTTSNIKGSNGVSVGISNGVITVTGTTYSTGTADKSGLTKLYPDIGVNTDGTMTQSAIKAALGTKQDTIDDLEAIRTGAGAGATAVQPAALGNYATKTALTTGLNMKQDLVADGTDGNFYVADYKSAWGDMFTLMPKDTKCNDADVKCALTHKNGKYGWEVVRE